MAGLRKWSNEEKLQLVALRDVCRLLWEDIAVYFPGSTDVMCRSQYSYIKSGKDAITRLAQPLPLPPEDPRPRLFAEKAKRAALLDARAGDVTANFFGDPLPGYSALDRRATGETAESIIKAYSRDGHPAAKPTLYWGRRSTLKAEQRVGLKP